MNNENLKKIAEESLLKSLEEVSDDQEIVEKLKDKVIIIKENNQIEVKHSDKTLSTQILLYLSAKFIGYKMLGIFSKPGSTTEEISKSLKVSPQALSRPLGTLIGSYIDKTEQGYKIRAYKILDFLKSLEEEKEIVSEGKNKRTKKVFSNKNNKKEEIKKFNLDKEGIKRLSEFLEIDESKLRSIFFFRQDDLTLINPKLISGENPKEKQFNATLLYLLSYKYCYNVSELPSSILRSKLNKIGKPSLVNLTSNLHKYPSHIIHEAGPKGSQKNYFLITSNGEELIKNKIKDFFKENE
ncbi:MAG: hypothetical protein ACOCRX_11855 [Candidatus Woesearchaeota archaeon]